jgi:hypothetical protein
VAEVNTGFEQFRHEFGGHIDSFGWLLKKRVGTLCYIWGLRKADFLLKTRRGVNRADATDEEENVTTGQLARLEGAE